MSTRSLIGIANKDNTIDYTYCHFDGYVENGVGESLLRNFTTKKSVVKLIKGGEARSIDFDGSVSYYPDTQPYSIVNDEYVVGLSGSEYIYLYVPELKTWIYKEVDRPEQNDNSLDYLFKESDWKLLVV